MKNQFFLIGLIIILFSVFFTACDDILEGIGEGLSEFVCPTITTEYEHQQVERDAVFTSCYTSDYGLDVEVEMIINGIIRVYTEDTTLTDVTRNANIPIKVTVAGRDVCGIEVQSIGAPLSGGENRYNGCESHYVNKQIDMSEEYCLAELNETLGTPLTDDRETKIIVDAFNSGCTTHINDRINITINYAE